MRTSLLPILLFVDVSVILKSLKNLPATLGKRLVNDELIVQGRVDKSACFNALGKARGRPVELFSEVLEVNVWHLNVVTQNCCGLGIVVISWDGGC